MRWRLKTAEDKITEVELNQVKDGAYLFKVDGKEVTFTEAEVSNFGLKTREVKLQIETWTTQKWRAATENRVIEVTPLGSGDSAASSLNEILTQMPGRVLKLLVADGAEVTRGQPLLIMEAMKMENEIRAPRDAVVEAIAVKPGQSVESGSLLIRLKKA